MQKEILEQMLEKMEITREDDGGTTTFVAMVKARVIVSLPTLLIEQAPGGVFQLSIAEQIEKILSVMFDEDIKVDPEKIPV